MPLRVTGETRRWPGAGGGGRFGPEPLLGSRGKGEAGQGRQLRTAGLNNSGAPWVTAMTCSVLVAGTGMFERNVASWDTQAR